MEEYRKKDPQGYKELLDTDLEEYWVRYTYTLVTCEPYFDFTPPAHPHSLSFSVFHSISYAPTEEQARCG